MKEHIFLVESDFERIKEKGYTPYGDLIIMNREKYKQLLKEIKKWNKDIMVKGLRRYIGQ